ncbi:MAG TPA: helix-turn-helix domain-containing protein [Solirubrobacteraceae bacterium]|nr:helix-turn-helix domain-containing protein [Solirubrobacteraceae bacterium]
MDKAALELLLQQGRSLAEIGKRFGKHEATIAYWVKKHGLEAAKRTRHAPRGGLPRDELATLVAEGASISVLARWFGCAPGTVRYWLRRYGLKTRAQRMLAGEESPRAAKDSGKVLVRRMCRHHGLTDFWLEGRGYYRCQRCRWEAVSRRRRKVKQILVEEAGGRCTLCGYNRCVAALHFHHVDPASKSFHVSEQGVTRSLGRARDEARKCVLLCSNCHAEVETGIAAVLQGAAGRDDT